MSGQSLCFQLRSIHPRICREKRVSTLQQKVRQFKEERQRLLADPMIRDEYKLGGFGSEESGSGNKLESGFGLGEEGEKTTCAISSATGISSMHDKAKTTNVGTSATTKLLAVTTSKQTFSDFSDQNGFSFAYAAADAYLANDTGKSAFLATNAASGYKSPLLMQTGCFDARGEEAGVAPVQPIVGTFNFTETAAAANPFQIKSGAAFSALALADDVISEGSEGEVESDFEGDEGETEDDEAEAEAEAKRAVSCSRRNSLKNTIRFGKEVVFYDQKHTSRGDTKDVFAIACPSAKSFCELFLQTTKSNISDSLQQTSLGEVK